MCSRNTAPQHRPVLVLTPIRRPSGRQADRRRPQNWRRTTCHHRPRSRLRLRPRRPYWHTSGHILRDPSATAVLLDTWVFEDLYTLDLALVALGLPQEQRSGFTVQGVGGVRISQQLGQKDFENVYHIEHRRPGLVDDVQANRPRAVTYPSALVLWLP